MQAESVTIIFHFHTINGRPMITITLQNISMDRWTSENEVKVNVEEFSPRHGYKWPAVQVKPNAFRLSLLY